MPLIVHAPGLLFAGTISDVAHLPLELFIVFGVAKLFGEIFDRFGQPGIVGEIVAGVVIGPAALGWVRSDAVLDALAQIGVMFLLFRVGLEVKVPKMLEVGGTALLVAVLGVAVPFGFGCLIMRGFAGSWIEAFFVGASLVATSVAVTAHVLKSKGLIDERASRVILGAAVIDDVLGLLVLALISSLAQRSVNVGGLIGTFLLAAGFTVVLAKYGSSAVKKSFPRLRRTLKAQEAEFNLVLVVLFGLSVLAVWVGIAAIVGAFLAGMALSETVARRSRVDLFAQGVTELLLPFFLVTIGLHVELRVFESTQAIALVIAITVAAILTKLVACGLGAWRYGRADMFRIGAGMIPRGEVGMVVAQLGLTLGVINNAVYGVVVVMTVITTLLAPPLLTFAYRGANRRVPQEDYTLT